MYLQYDIQKLNRAMQDFYNVTGINVNLLQADFSMTNCQAIIHNAYCKKIQESKEGLRRCLCSDGTLLERVRNSGKAEMHICHAGLADVAVPIIFEQEIVGYLILGQMKPDTDFSTLEQKLIQMGLDPVEMEQHYQELPYFDPDKIQSILNVAVMLAKYILLEEFLKPGFPENMEKAIAFIHSHLKQPLSVSAVAKSVNCSKSALYRYFHSHFQCTVNDYINRKRVEKSIELLRADDLSIEEIAEETGFSTASYYTRIFKKYFGCSPLKYKKTVLMK